MTEEKDVAVANGEENKDAAEDNGEGESSLDTAIIRQVEYYFSDANLPRDKFLRDQVLLDDGWVPLEILTRFNRLAKLTTDKDVIAKALLKSNTGLLEISDDNKKVRRNPELPIPEMSEERRKELMSRTIYAKGFPKESTLDDLLKFFKQYEEVENIIMRKYLERGTKKRLFKGSVFALFKTKEQAEKFISEKDQIKYQDSALLILWQEDYIKQKQDEYASKKEEKGKLKEKKNEERSEKPDFKLPTGCLLHFSEGNDKMTREDIKNALASLGAEIAYVDFKSGDTEGWVRLAKENAAKELVEKMTDNKVKIADKDVIFKILEGDEENTYLAKTIEDMAKKRRSMKNNKYNKGKNFRGKQGRKRKQDNNDDAPPSKVKADS